MTPEEHELLQKIFNLLSLLSVAFDRFTIEKKQRWQDEAARRRERAY